MNKKEFMEYARDFNSAVEEPSKLDYDNIEFVYNYHPCISNTNGKSEIAYLYVKFGLALILDMLPRAQLAKEAEEKVQAAKKAYDDAVKDYNNLKKGSRCV